MRFIFLSLLIFSIQVSFAQYNYGIKQVLENTESGWGTYMSANQNDIFIVKSRVDEVRVYGLMDDSTWAYKQTLKPSDKLSENKKYWYYGSTLDIDGDNAIVAAQYKAPMENEDGGLYFYHKGQGGMWSEELVFDNPTVQGNTRSYSYYGGKNITVHGNKATASHNNGYPRFVHVFERQGAGDWQIIDTITDPEFLGIDGIDPHFEDSLFITMVFRFDNQRVKEYTLQPNGNWLNTDTLSSGITDEDTYFGQTLRVDGNQMVIGAYSMNVETANDTLISAGAAFVYEKQNNKWHIQDTLYFDSLYNYTNFGNGIAIKDDLLVVSATNAKQGSVTTGAIVIYKKIAGDWKKIQTVYPDNTTSSFGRKIAILGGQIVASSSKGVYIIENLKDCNDVVGGSAMLNSCEICYRGTTGLDSLESEQSCVTSVNNEKHNRVIALHPNPVNNQLTVVLPANSKAFMVDLYGKKVIEKIQAGTNDLSELKAGTYLLIVESENKRDVFKVLKE